MARAGRGSGGQGGRHPPASMAAPPRPRPTAPAPGPPHSVNDDVRAASGSGSAGRRRLAALRRTLHVRGSARQRPRRAPVVLQDGVQRRVGGARHGFEEGGGRRGGGVGGRAVCARQGRRAETGLSLPPDTKPPPASRPTVDHRPSHAPNAPPPHHSSSRDAFSAPPASGSGHAAPGRWKRTDAPGASNASIAARWGGGRAQPTAAAALLRTRSARVDDHRVGVPRSAAHRSRTCESGAGGCVGGGAGGKRARRGGNGGGTCGARARSLAGPPPPPPPPRAPPPRGPGPGGGTAGAPRGERRGNGWGARAVPSRPPPPPPATAAAPERRLGIVRTSSQHRAARPARPAGSAVAGSAEAASGGAGVSNLPGDVQCVVMGTHGQRGGRREGEEGAR